MAFSDTMKIVPRDLSGPFYSGKPLRKSDVLTIDPRISRLMFRTPIEIKALNFSSATEVILVGPSKITHIMSSGRLVSLGDLFCGSVEAGGDIIINGDLNTWLGDVDSANGSICVSGDVMCSGHIRATYGVVIVNGEVEGEFEPETRIFWEGASGEALPQAAKQIAVDAGRIIKSVTPK